MKILFGRAVVGLLVSAGLIGVFGVSKPERKIKYKRESSLRRDTPPSRAVFVENQWADSVFSKLTVEQKIGQLFMIATYSDRNETYYRYVDQLIQNYHIGGLIFFKGGPSRQAKLTNRYQTKSTVPLMIGIDGEWGLGMRLDSVDDFPKQMTLGAIQDNRYVYRMGLEIGRQCQRLGITVNFAPVADINSNPRNPVIGLRSFGEDRDNVTDKAAAYMKGLQHQHVIATAKHFPGHGDTDTDSHYTLPVLSHSSDRLTETDLYPFRKLIADSLTGIITGHLYVPVLDNTPLLASSLSEKVVTDLLKKQMGFQGLVFTDAMNMQGVSRGRTAVEANVKALLAGNDILLYPESVAESIKRIKDGLLKGTIAPEVIDEKVRKILRAKYWLGLNRLQQILPSTLNADLQTSTFRALTRDLCEQAVTLVHNENHLLPIAALDTCTFASIAIGGGGINLFQQTLSRYAPFKHVVYAEKPTTNDEIESLLAQTAGAKVVIVSLHDTRRNFNRPFTITPATIDLLNRLQQKARVIVSLFGTPYALKQLPITSAVICAYENLPDLEIAAAQQIFGALPFKGKLPVSIEGMYNIGTGYETKALHRLFLGLPEQVGMSSAGLSKIDTLVERSIQAHIFPGCQVLVSRKGRVVFQKNYGTLSYDSYNEKVTNETLYDVASVTKVAATLQAVMYLQEQNAIDLKQKAAHYLPELIGTNKANITVEDLLLHRSGLVAFYPKLWERTKTGGGGLMTEYYSSLKDSVYSMQIAPKLFSKSMLKDSVWKWVVQSPMRKEVNGKYSFVYSDLGILMVQKVIERITNQPLDEFLSQNFYEPLGMMETGFKPLERFPESQIAPTESDFSYRNQLLRGTVHDQMAAVYGGVAGHAGLFSCAYDLAILMQMNLQKGLYGDRRYFQEETLPFFAKMADNANHRGLGWDKAPANGESNYVAASASPLSFGHSGFTGTMVWVDPKEELVFIFLSNRVNPNAENTEINRKKIRRRLHELVYQAILSNEK
ncbi:glycoside hydrolase family 3 N-terminal domain-containing protein [Runella sp.]|uniref:glycoside hydrolase family 3 N-terminal domain-containing protein n=1 Tax=Runella sp. TaxID=1960881 RepID=UPI0026018E47|nr:glycoside hydrolase family 3 N-terminal domain-containing protein [Runella sp.]